MKYLSKAYIKFYASSLVTIAFSIWSQNGYFFVLLPFFYEYFISKYVSSFIRKHRFGKIFRYKFWIYLESIIWAAIIALFIRVYMFEAFTIPSSSMQGTLKKGDYILTSKLSFGPRMPLTPWAVPFMHHTIPFTKKDAYTLKYQRDYQRLKAFGSLHRNDIVVFNFPWGDTIFTDYPGMNYYVTLRQYAKELQSLDIKDANPIQDENYYITRARKYIHKNRKLKYRPIDKREYYVKRLVGLPGDSLSILDGKLFINDSLLAEPKFLNKKHLVQTENKTKLDSFLLLENFDQPLHETSLGIEINLSDSLAEKMKKLDFISSIETFNNKDYTTANSFIFPFQEDYNWTEDEFGKLYIPAKGDSIAIDNSNIALYRRIIEVYEQNQLEIRNNAIFVNNKLAKTYIFKQNYYFVIGDNRHNSFDSRYWGFLPEDHLVGKGLFIWMSMDKEKKASRRIRWNRIFTNLK